MKYSIINGYVIHQAPVYPLDEDGIPTFLRDNEIFWWKMCRGLGLRQERYSAKNFSKPLERDVIERKDGKVYVCYTYSDHGSSWFECCWEELK